MPIRLGIIGCGSFIQRRILPYLHEIEEIQVTCIQKRDLKVAKEIAARFQIPYAVATKEELLRQPEVDAVMIATQNHLHEEDAVAAAEAKKPTLCEKPLAPTSEAVKRMLKAFHQASIPLCVGHSLRFKPSIQKAKEMLALGVLGKLLHLRAYFAIAVPKNSWKLKKEFGGGVLQDIGIHLIDLIQFISHEKITSLYAKAKGKEVDEEVWALCHLENGAIGSFDCSFQGPLRSGFEVIGTKGRLISTNSLRQTFDPVESLCLIKEDDTTLFLSLQASNIYVEELKHFAKVLKEKVPSLIPAEIGLLNQKIIELAYLSSKNGREVSLDSLN